MQIPIFRLTRRANHGHIIIIAYIIKLAPVNRPRAFSIAEILSAGKFQFIQPVARDFLTVKKSN
jgi:hypothetical protein